MNSISYIALLVLLGSGLAPQVAAQAVSRGMIGLTTLAHTFKQH